MSGLSTERDLMVAWLDAEKAPTHKGDIELSAYGRARTLVASLQHEVDALRWIIARNHGCPREAMYADDGEMSCNQRGCLIDFRRADAESLGRMLDRRWGRVRTCRECGGDPSAFCCTVVSTTCSACDLRICPNPTHAGYPR